MSQSSTPQPPPLRGSLAGARFVVGTLFVAALALLLGVAGRGDQDVERRAEEVRAFVCEQARAWREAYGAGPDLRVARVEVVFRPDPQLFVLGEGATFVPVATDLGEDHEIVDVAAHPEPLTVLDLEGNRVVAWPYAGRMRRALHHGALALVRSGPREPVETPASATRGDLADDVRALALLTADALEEHGLESCAHFLPWVDGFRGGNSAEQLLRMATALAEGHPSRAGEAPEDIETVCEALRAGRYGRHHAHVLAVMAARELGVPAFATNAAAGRRTRLLTVHFAETGWVHVDLRKPEDGYFRGGPVLLTRLPLGAPFPASRHNLWSPHGGAYTQLAPFGSDEISPFSRTLWDPGPEAGAAIPERTEHAAADGDPGADAAATYDESEEDDEAPGDEPTDVTRAHTVALAELCP